MTRATAPASRRPAAIRSARRTSHSWRSSRWSAPAHAAPSACRSTPRSRSTSCCISRDTHVGACTPLVTEVIGQSAGSNFGHSPANISRLTSPCNNETPLARCATRRPINAMLKTVWSPPGKLSAPRPSTRSIGSPSALSGGPKWCSTSSRGKRSMPGRHRRVRREQCGRANDLKRLVERQL